MKRFVIIAALLLPTFAFAQMSSEQNQQAQAQSGATNYGSGNSVNYASDRLRTSQQAPSIGVGGNIGNHLCTRTSGATLGTFPVAVGGAVSYGDDPCVLFNFGDFAQQSAFQEQKLYADFHGAYLDLYSRASDAKAPAELRTTLISEAGLASTEATLHQELANGLRMSSYEAMAEINPALRGILSRNKVIHGQAAVRSDQSGTVGMVPASTRIEANGN